MQKTQLTVLIEMIDNGIEGCNVMNANGEDAILEAKKVMLEAVKRDAISLLPKEQEDIEKAHKSGLTSNDVIGSQEVIYFNQTFTQYKP